MNGYCSTFELLELETATSSYYSEIVPSLSMNLKFAPVNSLFGAVCYLNVFASSSKGAFSSSLSLSDNVITS